ncbi:hypothetical protein HanXRQr2_Chr11g0475851 [Helianthus annuus]|uniref:Uncharacterized protein n=1 Tax=Helianthus annuus TaxID=4232 RepID=A0A9K3HLZ1_HELAN|nr:hypothetical protein HanXRQr2_Chr11g0475851 [Helianthus annuus]
MVLFFVLVNEIYTNVLGIVLLFGLVLTKFLDLFEEYGPQRIGGYYAPLIVFMYYFFGPSDYFGIVVSN